jgi:hypothetical protein
MISRGLHYVGQYCSLFTAKQLWMAINTTSFYNRGVFNNIIWDSSSCQIKLTPSLTMVNEAFMKVDHDYYQYLRYLPDEQFAIKLSAAIYKVELLQKLKQTEVDRVTD